MEMKTVPNSSRTRTYLLPDVSISLMPMPIQGSIRKVVNALIRNEAEFELRPMLERRTSTPASSRI